MEKILVTGGAGFIGSHLVDFLIEKGHYVRIIDNLSTGKMENVNPSADFLWGDIYDEHAVTKALDGIDVCIHLAAVASVTKSIEQWKSSSKTNIIGTANIFEQGAKSQLKAVVYASSAAVYGNPSDTLITEESEIAPLSPYGADKYACELYAASAQKCLKIGSVGLRFFNVYGTRQDPFSPYSGVISQFIKKINENSPVRIFGTGMQTRDFVYVQDIVKALYLSIAMALTKTNKVYNVCTAKEISINDLVNILYDLAGKKQEIVYEAARDGDILHSKGSNEKITKELGGIEFTSLTDGLRSLVN